jgi:hypothetical protein
MPVFSVDDNRPYFLMMTNGDCDSDIPATREQEGLLPSAHTIFSVPEPPPSSKDNLGKALLISAGGFPPTLNPISKYAFRMAHSQNIVVGTSL